MVKNPQINEYSDLYIYSYICRIDLITNRHNLITNIHKLVWSTLIALLSVPITKLNMKPSSSQKLRC